MVELRWTTTHTIVPDLGGGLVIRVPKFTDFSIG